MSGLGHDRDGRTGTRPAGGGRTSPEGHPPPPAADERPLPGEDVISSLRGRICRLILGPGRVADPAARIADKLNLWSAFDRSWLARLLPDVVTPADPAEDVGAEPDGLPDLDPKTADGRRLQVVWTELAEELVRRGRSLNGADLLPLGVEDLTTDVYLTAARRWPAFVYRDREHTVRWLLSILHNLLRRAVDRAYNGETVPLPTDPAGGPPTDPSRSRGTRSRAEERELMAGRTLLLHGRLAAECRAPDLETRVHGQPTLQLFVAAESLATALRLSPEDCRQWGLLAVRQMETAEVARLARVTANALNVRFHRARMTAIGLLAECWAAAVADRD
jgi:DNA-directed RNA polymerase specialized sigma24 family protein